MMMIIIINNRHCAKFLTENLLLNSIKAMALLSPQRSKLEKQRG